MPIRAKTLIGDFREHNLDQREPYFWSDEAILRYLDKAQKKFCRDAVPILDSTSGITRVVIRTGVDTVKYNEAIIRIRSARLQSTGKILTIKTQEAYLGSNIFNAIGKPGSLDYCFVDYDEETIRFDHVPAIDDILMLHVERKPFITLDKEDSIVEVKEDYHQAVLEWAYYLSYSKQDSETFDMNKAEDAMANYDREVVLAKRVHTKRHSRMGQIQYGGI